MRRLAFTFSLTLLLSSAGVAQDSMNVRRVGVYTSLAGDVEVSGDHAYLVGDSMFRVISIADPEQPVQVGYVEAPGTRLTVRGDYAFVVANRDGLRIVSIADPTNPVVVGHIDAKRSIKEVDVVGDFAYVADWDSGLRVISVADPTSPVEVAHIDTLGVTNSVAVGGDYAYVGAERLGVVLISDPTNPLGVGSCHMTRSPAEHMAVIGYYVYAEGWLASKLMAFRVADPIHPVQVWQRDGACGGVAVEGSCLYVGANGIKVFSLADPGRPVEIGHYTIGGIAEAAGVAAAGGYAYVACSSAGLQIFQYYGPGIEESPKPLTSNHKPAATVLSGASDVKRLASSAVFDAMGRRVANPRSGVYFVREAHAQAIIKVLVTW